MNAEVRLPAMVHLEITLDEPGPRVDRIVLTASDGRPFISSESEDGAGDAAADWAEVNVWEPLTVLGDAEPGPAIRGPAGNVWDYRTRNSELATALEDFADGEEDWIGELLRESARRLYLVSKIEWEG